MKSFAYIQDKNNVVSQSIFRSLLRFSATRFLTLTLKNQNIIIDFYTIEYTLWPDKDININTIRTLVKRVRQKLKHKFIQTIPSRGYKFIITDKCQLLS